MTGSANQAIENAYARGRVWAVASGSPYVELLHKLYGVITNQVTMGSRGRMFRERDFPPETVRALFSLTYELVNNEKVFPAEHYEAAVAFLNGVRDGCWRGLNRAALTSLNLTVAPASLPVNGHLPALPAPH